MEAYERKWRSKYERDLVLHKQIREFANWISDEQACRYARIAKKLGIERFLSTYGDMDSPSAILKGLEKERLLAGLYGKVLGTLAPLGKGTFGVG